jgi:hypothetical protein
MADYPTSEQHPNLFVELLGTTGCLLYAIRLPAPVNSSAQASISMRISIEHMCGCKKILSTRAIDPYD